METEMTLTEFKAWLEGYSTSFEGNAPNAEQWAEIAQRLSNVKQQYFTSGPILAPGIQPSLTFPEKHVTTSDQTYLPSSARSNALNRV